jgi:hypothetical protein
LCFLCGNALPSCKYCTSSTNCILCLNSLFLYKSNCYLCGMLLSCQTFSNGTTSMTCRLG